MDLRIGILLAMLGVSLSSAQMAMPCSFPIETNVYTCIYTALPGQTITETTLVTPAHIGGGFANSDVRAVILSGSGIIAGIPTALFVQFAGIQHLYILDSSSMTFTMTPGQPMYTSLRNITISNNQGASLGVNPFQRFPNLLNVEIARNTFQPGANLPDSTFLNPNVVRYLDMGQNTNLNLPPTFFQHMNNLRTLSINGSTVTLAQNNPFNGLSNLHSLYMHGCGINTLGVNMFSALTNLEYLGLGHNTIANLQANSFTGLTNLRVLNLQSNAIAAITSGAFTGLVNLQVLDLSHNPNIVYAGPMFTGLSTLPSIILSHNNIQHDQLTPAIMTVLTNLTSIDVSNNNITRIVGGMFSGNRQLSIINLRNNGVNSIEYTFFEQFISAELNLNLEGNACSNYNFIVFNRNFHKVHDELWDCFNNFSHAAGYNVPKFAIILLVLFKFLGLY